MTSIANTTVTPLPIGPIPDWNGLVDQAKPEALAEFIREFPIAKTITFDELSKINEEAVAMTKADVFPQLTVSLDRDGLKVVVDAHSKPEDCNLFNCVYGTHLVHGNYAVFWSIRGPGYLDGEGALPRYRPCFLFCDQSAVMFEGVA